MASLAAALAGYPLGIVEECCDPRTGLARSREFLPTVAAIVEWCDRQLKYHLTIAEWKPLPQRPPEREFSAEHRQKMLTRLSKVMHEMFDQKQERSNA